MAETGLWPARPLKLIPPTHLWCAPASGRCHTVLGGATCGKAAADAAERKPQTLERAPGSAAAVGAGEFRASKRVKMKIFVKSQVWFEVHIVL